MGHGEIETDQPRGRRRWTAGEAIGNHQSPVYFKIDGALAVIGSNLAFDLATLGLT